MKEFNLFESNDKDFFEFIDRKNDLDYLRLKNNLKNIAASDPNFIIYKIGMREIIDNIFREFKSEKNLNDEYQLPLKYLYETKKYPEIIKIGEKYYCRKLENGFILVDDKGEWILANKLNTNYSDLSVLLSDLFYFGKQHIRLSKLKIEELKLYLNEIKNHLPKLISKYFTFEDLKNYTEHIKSKSLEGEISENKIEKSFVNMGWEILYHGGNGDFIDMIFGIDLIVRNKHSNNIRTIQVKSSRNGVEKASKNPTYNKIDLILNPTSNGFEGIQRVSNNSIKFIKYKD